MKVTFKDQQKINQVIWRKSHISSDDWGYQHKKFNKDGKENQSYEYIIPRHLWHQALWIGIRTELPKYLGTDIKAHSGTHNLLSSWIVCANLYFPVKMFPDFKRVMLEFLQKKISPNIIEITDVELEFAFDDELSPSILLGEMDGIRGSGQTSPDVAFIVKTISGAGIILTECKYTEHSFYSCSARTTEDSEKKPKNLDPARCMNPAKGYDYTKICHQTLWKRKYWSCLDISHAGETTLLRCPAATAGYQLFRQQALAEGIKNSGRYSLVASTVAFDARNTNLIGCLQSTGLTDFQSDWAPIFKGNAIFKTWTHQEWVDFVRTKKGNRDWVNYIKERYDY